MTEEVKVDTETTENNSEGVEETSKETSTDSVESEAETEAPKEESEKPKLTKEQLLGIRKREVKKLEKELGINTSENEAPKSKQSNEPDYGRIAYLNSEGINHSDDQKVVLDEANRLKLPLTEVRAMEHVKSRLQANKDQREAVAGSTIKGGSRAGGNTKHDVDYWLNKGGDERPDDPELARKVLNAKMAKQASTNKFSDMMYS